jgi:hypothetical protein
VDPSVGLEMLSNKIKFVFTRSRITDRPVTNLIGPVSNLIGIQFSSGLLFSHLLHKQVKFKIPNL